MTNTERNDRIVDLLVNRGVDIDASPIEVLFDEFGLRDVVLASTLQVRELTGFVVPGVVVKEIDQKTFTPIPQTPAKALAALQ